MTSSREKPFTAKSLGAKGDNLQRLTAGGMCVPEWFAVPFKWFELFIEPVLPVLAAITNDMLSGKQLNCTAVSADLISRLSSVKFPAELHSFVEVNLKQLAGNVAVRSSGSHEDTRNASFAGIFETYLNVRHEEVLSRIRDCWLSAFTPNAIAYMCQTKITPVELRIGVIVQTMIDARCAGVHFTANPQGYFHESVIVAGPGLGQGIVDGCVTTDTYYVNRFDGAISADVGLKDTQIVMDVENGGTIEVDVKFGANQPVLSFAELEELISCCKRIENIYSYPQDIEWAFDRTGKLWILQSRPITAIDTSSATIFDRSNIGENYPGVSLPLTISITKDMYKRMFTGAFKACGYSDRFRENNETIFSELIEAINGRLFYNLSAWTGMLSLAPFGESILAPSLQSSIGTNSSLVGPTSFSFSALINKAVGLVALVRYALNYRKALTTYKHNYDVFYSDIRAKLHSAMNKSEWASIVRRIMDESASLEPFGRISDVFLMSLVWIVNRWLLVAGVSEVDARNSVNEILSHNGGLQSAEPIRAISCLVDLIKANGLLSQLSEVKRYDQLIDILEKHPPLKRAWMNYIEKYGDRSPEELKLETETVRCAPLRLLTLILNGASSAEKSVSTVSTPVVQGNVQHNTAKRASLVILVLKRKISALLVTREMVRFNRARTIGLLREAYRKIAGAFVSDGLLQSVEQVYYLTSDEITRHVSGEQLQIDSIVNERIEQFKRYRLCEVGQKVVLSPRQRELPIRQANNLSHNGSGARSGNPLNITGIGCYPGLLSAPAVVLMEPRQDIVLSGKILVSAETDPGWAFLMSQASGIIMERGSLLSHAAIIGREMAIPTIVAANGVTKKIHSGQKLTMDGASGKIEIENSFPVKEPRALIAT